MTIKYKVTVEFNLYSDDPSVKAARDELGRAEVIADEFQRRIAAINRNVYVGHAGVKRVEISDVYEVLEET